MTLAAFIRKKPTLEIARRLIGCKLSTFNKNKLCSGMIVEVEAYHGSIDEASHSFRGETKRTEIMFREAGYCYVYLIYGMHYCVNIVTEKSGIGAAVLIRAIEPLEGLNEMYRRRGLTNTSPHKSKYSLCNGPAKLCEALAIDKKHNGLSFFDSTKIKIEYYKRFRAQQIATTTRIGITKSIGLPWRFYLKDNPWVSRF